MSRLIAIFGVILRGQISMRTKKIGTRIKLAIGQIGILSTASFLVALGILTNVGLTSQVIAAGGGADASGNSAGGVADNGGLFISTASAAWKAQDLNDIAAGNIPGVSMDGNGVITIKGFDGTGGFHASGGTIQCPAGTTHLYMYSLVAQRSDYGYNKGDLVGLMGMDGNSAVYNSSEFGGGTRYDTSVPGALDFDSVANTYNSLYNQGLVHIGWGNGAGLSMFCSSGDGLPSNPNPSCGGVSGDTTYMTTKVMDYRLAHKGWVNEIYAKPTDQVRWNNCYTAGVQNKYWARSHEFSEITGSYYWRSDDPEPDYSVHYNHNHITTNIDVININRFFAESRWQNFFRIDRNFSPLPSSFGDDGGDYSLGSAVSKQRVDDYQINQVGDVGTMKFDSSYTGEPTRYSMWSNYHTWCGTGGCEWEVWEQNGSACGYNGAWRPAGYAWSYWDDWSGPGHWVYSEPYYDEYAEAKWCWVTHSDYNRHNRSWESAYFIESPTGETASVYVPYNFVNSTTLRIEQPSDGVVYSGDTLNILEASATVGVKGNNLVEDVYATVVRNAKVRLVAYATSDPNTFSPTSGDDLCSAVAASYINGRRLCEASALADRNLNSTGNLAGDKEDFADARGTHVVFDANAGDYMCYAMAIYPSHSGADWNWQDPEGNHQWSYSQPQCVKIAKKPNFGVYGGSVYSAAKIATTSMGKTNIFGDGDYDFHQVWVNGIKAKKYFGSFAEQSVFGINAITGLASGSAYLENIGISNNDYCNNLIPITFANAGNTACNGSNSGAAGFMGEIDEISVDKDSYVDFWLRSSLDTGEKTSDAWGESTKYYSNTGKNIYYTYINNGGNVFALSGMDIPNSTTRLVKASGDIEITGNIRYSESDDSHKINSAGDIPQVIIYANNISIRCDVTQIDAILIAKGAVNTCSGASIDGYINGNYGLPVLNNPNASHPLTIRGVVIADYAYLYRTYGAAVDGYSGTPAETINYDSSSLLWARYMAGASESNTMTEVYRTELAPRY